MGSSKDCSKTQKEEKIDQPSNQQEKQRMLTDEWEAVPEYIPVPQRIMT